MTGSVLRPGLVRGIFDQSLEQRLDPGGRVEGVPSEVLEGRRSQCAGHEHQRVFHVRLQRIYDRLFQNAELFLKCKTGDLSIHFGDVVVLNPLDQLLRCPFFEKNVQPSLDRMWWVTLRIV